MRLFYQLTEKEQNDVIHHCANLVVEDMINDGVKLEPTTEDDFKLKERLEEAVKYIHTLSSKKEKTDYLMTDEYISKAIYDIGLEMAKSAFYHDDEEMVIFPASLKDEEKDEDDDVEILNVQTKSKKSSHSIN